MTTDLVAVGRVYADLVYTGLDAPPAPGREVFAAGLRLAPGGGAFITASYAAALGLGAALWAVRPAAPFDACVVAGLGRNGVLDLTAPPPEGTDPQVTAAISGPGDRAFVTRRAGPVAPAGALPEARHLHLGEMTTALERPDLIETARARGMTVSLDCGWDAAMFADPRLAATIAAVDVFLPNAEEHAELLRRGVALAPKAALVVKLGAEGARAEAAGRSAAMPALPSEVRDTTGAGDAFNAGFLAAWLAGRGLEQCLAGGCACGAVAVGRIGGAEDLPRLDAARSKRPEWSPESAR